jgi:hypothetical protein
MNEKKTILAGKDFGGKIVLAGKYLAGKIEFSSSKKNPELLCKDKLFLFKSQTRFCLKLTD